MVKKPNQPSMPVNAALATGATPRPTIRLQAPDVPERSDTPLVLPSPESLGISVTRTVVADIDWNDVRLRLRRLGAVGFHLDQDAGQWRATLLVPAGAQQTRHVEALAGNDAAAVAGALQKAEALLQGR